MTTTLTAPASVHAQLQDHLERIRVRDRIDAELTRMMLDVIGPCDRDELTADERAWLNDQVAHVVSVVLDPALAQLTIELAAGLVDAPETLMARVGRARLRREFGGE